MTYAEYLVLEALDRVLFRPDWEYGNSLIYPLGRRDLAVDRIREDGLDFMPPGIPFEIRECQSYDYGRVHAVAWYYGGNR